MCGIAGTLQLDTARGPVDIAALEQMSASMKQRGPDGSGIWSAPDGRVALAHRRLAIIDLADTGAQPMHSADGRFTITYNGEIYNYEELRRELIDQGCRFRSTSDTEVLLELFARDGADMVHRLRGMFAFAIWDATAGRMFLARDHFGIKPLYYTTTGASFRFASQVGALLAGGGIDTTPAAAGHVGFYLLGHVPEPWTLHAGIACLPAGSWTWATAAGHEEPHRYWDVTTAIRTAPEPDGPGDSDDLRAALLSSVRRHLVADVPVGLFLSAGLDSPALTGLATELQPQPPRTVTLGFREFEGTELDEAPLASRIAEHYATRHETRWVRGADFHDHLDAVLSAMDQPTIDGVNTYFVSRATAQSGLKVALSGAGADELFGGYSLFADLPRLVDRLRLGRRVPRLGRALRWVSAGAARRLGRPKYAGLLEYGGDYASGYLLRRGLYMPWELPDVLDPDMAREGWRDLELLTRLDGTIEGIDDPHTKVTALELCWYMRNQLMRDADWAGMAHSLEIRVPFVDVDLLTAVVGIRRAGGVADKQAMARAPLPTLPHEVLARPKTGFAIPVRDWLLDDRSPARADVGLRAWARAVHAAKAA